MTDTRAHEQQLDHLKNAVAVTPGAGQTRSRAPGHVGPDDTQLPFPLFACRARGAYVWQGSSYATPPLLDCFGANAAVPIGHAHPNVVSAVMRALNDGNLPSVASFHEEEASAMFLKSVAPWADKVRWVKTGTEAVMAAVRMARAHTGRERIVVMDSSYHGWSDLNDARHTQQGQSNGVPKCTAELTQVVPYHTDPQHWPAGSYAAVLVEPHRWIKTDVDWLQSVRNYCTTTGTVMIMDEMVYGLRWALGGASDYYGIKPDLACYGKALGGGVPVALVCGQQDIMQQARYVSGTYFGDTIALAAAVAVMQLYPVLDSSGHSVIDQLWRRGELTWHGFSSAYHGTRARLDGFFVHWRLLVPDTATMDRVQVLAAERGVLFHKASNNASAAMTDTEAYDAGLVIGGAVNEVLEGK